MTSTTSTTTPAAPDLDAMRAAWVWVTALIGTGLPVPRDVHVNADATFAHVTFTDVHHIDIWAAAVGAPEVTVFRCVQDIDGVPHRATLTSTALIIESGTRTSLNHYGYTPLTTPDDGGEVPE